MESWLARQVEYQLGTYGYDLPAMQLDAEKLTDYVTMNLYAAQIEIAEAAQVTPWKPWSSADKTDTWARNRDKFVGEIVDVLFFVANALCAAGCSDEELSERYDAKMGINTQRQRDGYDGTNKCDACGGALDEPTIVKIFATAGGERYCSDACLAAGPR